MNEVLPMKKIMLLLASSLLLVSCGSNKVKYDLQTIKPFVPVEIPEAHDIDKETARSLTDGLIVEYDRWYREKSKEPLSRHMISNTKTLMILSDILLNVTITVGRDLIPF